MSVNNSDKKNFPWLVIGFCVLMLIAGCTRSPLPPQVKLTRFEPAAEPHLTTFYDTETNEFFASYESSAVRVVATLFESQSLLVMPVTIFNHTGEKILPEEYSISLYDGRDYKPIKRLERRDILEVQAKFNGRPGGGNIESQVINSVFDSVSAIAINPNKQVVAKGIDTAVDNYFSFRPIYAHEKRFGILCFLLEFKAEYPLSLKVRVKDQDILIRFRPKAE